LNSSYTNGKIGGYCNVAQALYQGDLGEIIIYNRALSDFERQQIEQYLSKKWAIKLS